MPDGAHVCVCVSVRLQRCGFELRLRLLTKRLCRRRRTSTSLRRFNTLGYQGPRCCGRQQRTGCTTNFRDFPNDFLESFLGSAVRATFLIMMTPVRLAQAFVNTDNHRGDRGASPRQLLHPRDARLPRPRCASLQQPWFALSKRRFRGTRHTHAGPCSRVGLYI